MTTETDPTAIAREALAAGRAVIVFAARRPEHILGAGDIVAISPAGDIRFADGRAAHTDFIGVVRVLADDEPGIVWLLQQHWEFEAPSLIAVHATRTGAQAHPFTREDRVIYDHVQITPQILGA